MDKTSIISLTSFTTDFFQETLEECYERKIRKKKTSEPSWMTDWLRDEIEARRKVYKTDQKRSERWKVPR